MHLQWGWLHMSREPVTIVEIDLDRCSRIFGVGGCTAALAGLTVRKCYNSIQSCPVPALFLTAPFTVRFSEPRATLPKDVLYFPAVLSVSMFSASVNLAGADPKLSPLGRRATVSVELQDFTYHDRALDPYSAGRVDGTAQTDEPGYSPEARGTFFGKLKARWPYYPGRPLRVVSGYLEAGVLVDARTRNFVMTDIKGPDEGGRVRIEAKDILDLADNDRALAPSPSLGYLSAAILATDTVVNLTPAGVGGSYPASGRAVIGSEIVSYTMAGSTATLTARGLAGTVAADHAAQDSFQSVLWFKAARIDLVLSQLLQTYAGVPGGFVPNVDWQAEVLRWMPDLKISAHICEPTGVAALIGELSALGFSIWWDDVSQKIGLKANRPADMDTVFTLSDAANIKSLVQDDRAEDRLTEVLYHTVQIDPTKGAATAENFLRVTATYDLAAKSALRFGDARVRRIYCRWLDKGADSVVSLISWRLLKRFSASPVQIKVKLDAKDIAIGLTDIVELESNSIQDATGLPILTAFQVIAKSEPILGHEIELTLQAYPFDARYGFSADNARGNYGVATKAQKKRGTYIVNSASLLFADGEGPYRLI